MSRRRAAVLAVAVALDLMLGEPPSPLHPVVWLGGLIQLLVRAVPRQGRAGQLAWGAAVTAAVPVSAAVIALLVERAARRTGAAGILGEALALKTTFAVRALLAAGETTRRALTDGALEEARGSLRSLVSRDASGLGPSQVAAAAIESLAENATDSVLAPWLAYALAGLPGAAAYRAINTLDSMIGYRGRYEYLGKAAAWLDDLVNLAPARLAAALLTLAAPAGAGSVAGALRGALRDHRRTASPNAGWTMSAMAGALGLQLEKRGAYVLGNGRPPDARDIRRAQRVLTAAAGAGLGAVTALLAADRGRRGRGAAMADRSD